LAPRSRVSFSRLFTRGLAAVAGFFAAAAALAAPPAACRLLAEPAAAELMGSLLVKLQRACSPSGRPWQDGEHPRGRTKDIDTLADAAVNDPSLDLMATSLSHTQHETALARSPQTGTLCAGYNDTYHLITEDRGFSGVSRSLDGGATWLDGGALGEGSGGGPSLVFRQADGRFYYAALHTDGVGVWRSNDDCASFLFLGLAHAGSSDDKARLVADNHPGSPRFGRLYLAYTDFSSGRIFAVSSDDGGAAWSAPVAISAAGAVVQSAWPTVAPNGDLYVAYTRWHSFPAGPIAIELARSINGGASFTAASPPLASGPLPRDSGATASCGRAALAGNVRYLPAPQLAAADDGSLHVVFSYDPDGLDGGDVVDVFYRRSLDGGASWGPELRLSDDGTSRDQFSPALAALGSRVLTVSWYDRRLDPGNLLFDRYARQSVDGGISFSPSFRLSDLSSPIRLDPELPSCFHGDYDQLLAGPAQVVVLWSDDRNVQDGHRDADVYGDLLAAPLFGDGFESGGTSAWSSTVP
jgi:hypothetical protein